MSKKTNGPLSVKAVRELAENWQRCRSEDVASLFSAYDVKQAQTERVVTYKLKRKAFERLYTHAVNGNNPRLIVHLGLQKDHYSVRVPTEPPFVLMIEALHEISEYQKNCEILEWEPNSKFDDPDGAESGENAIPPASAYLFVQSWLETPLEELADVFQSIEHEQDRRVKAYVFSEEESASIISDMANSLESNAGELYLHLGDGLAVKGHPYSFRPVLEVVSAVNPKKPGKTPRNVTGLADDDGNSYYDFSRPVPPPIPT